MKNIMLIIQKLNGGGAERAVANLSKDLDSRFNITLVVFDGKDIAYPYSGDLVDLNLPAEKNKIKKLITMFKRIRLIKRIKKERKIDCSISFMPGANIVNLLSKCNDKIITSQRNMMSIVTKSTLSKLSIWIVERLSDETVALSNGVKYDLEENFRLCNKKIKTIYNSCDLNCYMRSSEKVERLILELDDNYRYIVTVGRLHNQKGQWHLIKAFNEVCKKIPKIKLIVLGEGELELELKQLCKNLGIEENVIFLGYVKNHHKLIKKCDLFVLSSIVEGLGNVVLEAMACGLPVISTDCFSGPREIIAPTTDILKKTNEIEMCDYGILTPAFPIDTIDIDNKTVSQEELAMSEAIIKILSNKTLEKHYSNKSLERINDFSSDNIAKQWIDLINHNIG